MELIGIGDLHLTSPGPKGNIGGLSAYINDHDNFVADLVITQPLAFAKKRHIENVVLYGDLFEKPRASYEGMLALLKILEQPFQFHIILGNHDMFGEEPTLGHSLQIIQKMQLPNVHIYTEPCLKKFGKAAVNFLPYPHSNFKDTALNVAHIDVEGAKSDSGRPLNGPKSTATAVVGHIHTKQKVRNTHYSGTLYQTNFGEAADKYFHHCVFEAGEWEIHNVPVKPVYRLHTVEVAHKRDLADVPASSKDLVKLILLDSSAVQAADYAHLNVVRTRAVSSSADLQLARVEDLHDGQEIEFSVDEFFDTWLEAQPVEDKLKQQATKLRNKLLRGKE